MTCSFDVKDGKLVNVQYVSGKFDCREQKLTSLEGCPQKIIGNFTCAYNQLTNLEGAPKQIEGDFLCYYDRLTSLKGSPEKVANNFDCSNNNLTNLEGCPQEIGGRVDCSDNPNLVDISDFPSSCSYIWIGNCPKITKFPEKIDNTLEFFDPKRGVRRRIKEVLFYEVIEEDKDSITVRQKMIGQQLLDVL